MPNVPLWTGSVIVVNVDSVPATTATADDGCLAVFFQIQDTIWVFRELLLIPADGLFWRFPFRLNSDCPDGCISHRSALVFQKPRPDHQERPGAERLRTVRLVEILAADYLDAELLRLCDRGHYALEASLFRQPQDRLA